MASSASLPKPCHLPPQLPWLMIRYEPDPEVAYLNPDKYSKSGEDDGIRLFYDLWQSKMHKLHLPETIGKMCYASYRGWLVLVAPLGKEVFLLNPLTQARIQLPPFTTPVKLIGVEQEDSLFEDHHWFELYTNNFFISKLSFSTDLTGPNCLIMVFLQRTSQILFCQVGDSCWTMVKIAREETDVTYHNGRFYLLSYQGVMRAYDLNNPQKRLFSSHRELQFVTKLFLEGKSGVYIVVIHDKEEREEAAAAQEEPDDHTHDAENTVKDSKQKIKLYQLLEQPFGLNQITDTGNTTIFYRDYYHCLGVSSDDWDSLDRGCMYFADVCRPIAGKDKGKASYGIYFAKLGDGESVLVVHGLGEPLRVWPAAAAMWFQPSLV